jgi:SET domain-containing protein
VARDSGEFIKYLNIINARIIYGPLIDRGAPGPIEIYYVNNEVKYGARATRDILPGDYIGEYVGRVITGSNLITHALQLKALGLEFPNSSRYMIPVSFEAMSIGPGSLFYVDANEAGNETRFINHSAQPANVVMLKSFIYQGMPRLIFVASKPVAKGKQLLLDYGEEYWRSLKITPHELEE